MNQQASYFTPYPTHPPSGLRLLATLLRNPIEAWTQEHFEQAVVAAKTPFGSRLIVSAPNLIRHILVDNCTNYTRDPVQKRILTRTTGCSIFMSSGETWRDQRRAMAPFFSPKALRGYLPEMHGAADRFASRLAARDGAQVCVHEEMAIITVNTVARNLFPHGLGGESPETVAASVQRLAVRMGLIRLGDLLNLPTWLPGPASLAGFPAATGVRRRSTKMVSQARQATSIADPPTITAALLEQIDKADQSDSSIRQVEDNIATLLGAGTDTTASALTWAVVLLAEAPEAHAHVQQEALRFAGNRNEVDQLVWTRAVIQEAMRLFPPAPVIGRMALKDDAFGDVHIPEGSEILIAPWVVHRHRLLWQEPDAFKPERFLDENRGAVPRFGYLPFGAGPRICIGAQYAMQQMIIVLSRLCATLRLENIADEILKLQQYITLQPAGRYRMTVRAVHGD